MVKFSKVDNYFRATNSVARDEALEIIEINDPEYLPGAKYWLSKTRCVFFFAMDNSKSKPIGVCVLCISYKVAEILYLDVYEEFRSKGIGTHLAELAIDEARNMKFGLLEVITSEDNVESNKLYRKLDFKLKSTSKSRSKFEPKVMKNKYIKNLREK